MKTNLTGNAKTFLPELLPSALVPESPQLRVAKSSKQEVYLLFVVQRVVFILVSEPCTYV